MSHFDGESSAGLAELWAAKATGTIATDAKARTRLKDLNTRPLMRFILRN
jgi:hypothetical protein